MQGPEKNSYKEFDNEKKIPAARKFPSPPITFLMVRPLVLQYSVCFQHFTKWNLGILSNLTLASFRSARVKGSENQLSDYMTTEPGLVRDPDIVSRYSG